VLPKATSIPRLAQVWATSGAIEGRGKV